MFGDLPRVRFATPAVSFVPSRSAVSHVTVVCEDGAPVVVAVSPGVVRALVLVWATDSGGDLDVDAVRAGGVQILPWDLDCAALDQLQRLHDTFPLDRHDVWVDGKLLIPCPVTLRTVPGLDLDRRIAAALAAKTPILPN